jgi:hypothetical protein
VCHGNSKARKGWEALLATSKNATTDAWDYLTRTPHERLNGRVQPLKGKLSTAYHDGAEYPRWQYEVTSGGRIWYIVCNDRTGKHAGLVVLLLAEPGHPKATERGVNRR